VSANSAARGGRAAWRGLRTVTHARGAGESGLARVLELHLVAATADTLILTALASTIFFAVPTEQARGRVATSLLVTMVPFVVLAPLIGPLLDRFRRGRRYALATTMVIRAFLAWVMAGAVGGAAAKTVGGAVSTQVAFSLYPAAFGFLVCQKAYIVTRAAALPRVLPQGTGLVAANSRISLAGVAATIVAAPLGTGLNTWLGPSVTLRLAFVVFAAGTALALALSPQVDSPDVHPAAGHPAAGRFAGSRFAGRTSRPGDVDHHFGPGRAARVRLGPRVVLGLRANAVLRAFTGPSRRTCGGARSGPRPTGPMPAISGSCWRAGRLPECWIPPTEVVEARALLGCTHAVITRRGCSGIHAVLFHQGATPCADLGTSAGRARLAEVAAEQLSPVGRTQVDAAVLMLEATEAQMDILHRQLLWIARHMRGARELEQRLYGVGPITGLALTCWLGGAGRFSSARKEVRFAGLDITARS
jgi:MFS family permease